MSKYIPTEIEPKWQKEWNKTATDLSDFKKKYYLLIELPYPSGDLHMGHWFTFAVCDILARLKKMQGYNVFMPIGFDAFGLPAENAAISRKIHPKDWTFGNIEAMKKQFATMGTLDDFVHGVITCEPKYYKWNQWIFLKMFENGLAYRGKALANWCPKDQCVLANENVENGRCWRCGSEVVQKEVDQWFLKITDYAEKLEWKNPPRVGWPKSLVDGQNNWIGKSEGVTIKFMVHSSWSMGKQQAINDKQSFSTNKRLTINDSIEVFTTRPDTLYGATYMVLAPEHPLVGRLTTKENQKRVKEYIEKAKKRSELERKESREKTGVFTGSHVTNPVSGEKIPVWVADYVLMGYGTGAIMAVPAHDARDFEFAKKYDLKIKQVIRESESQRVRDDGAYEGAGTIVNSGDWNGLKVPEEIGKVVDSLVKKGIAERKVYYHLHDWSISRQRYWGTPIPIIYCDNCGTVPVPEKDLPVELPYEVDYAPKGKAPLATAEEWVKVKCPNCRSDARREVETMDTFVDSSWYFLRYLDRDNEKQIFDKGVVERWAPAEIYVGGAEHTLGHTLYSRFFVKFLHDLGLISFDEYAKKRIHHGVILGTDGQRMSKSHGNVVNPDEQVAQYGADAVRMYLAFLGPYDLVAPWVPGGIRGVYHFLQRVWELADNFVAGPVGSSSHPTSSTNSSSKQNGNSRVGLRALDGTPSVAATREKLSEEDLYFMHKTIKKVTEDVENIKFNTAVAALMEWLNALSKKVHSTEIIDHSKKKQLRTQNSGLITREEVETLLLLLAPFAPHITEEVWQRIRVKESKSQSGKWSIHQQAWPKWDPKYVKSEKVTIVIQVNGRVRDEVLVEAGSDQQKVEGLALASEKVLKYAGKQKPQRVVFVKDRLINFVV